MVAFDEMSGGMDTDVTSAANRALAPLAVIIVTYNSGEVLCGLLDSLADGLAGIDRYEVIIADNASSDDSVAIATDHSSRPRILQTGRNAGYAAAINAATSTLSDDADVLVLNPDLRLSAGVAASLRHRLQDPKTGIAVPRTMTHEGTLAPSLRREQSLLSAWATALIGGRLASSFGFGDVITDPAAYRRPRDVEWATGAILMISARARRVVGPWDESFFLYCEEVDYMRRTRQAGFSVAYCPDAAASHIGGAYQENPLLLSLMAVNQLRDFARHNGRLRTILFRLGLIVGEVLRAPGNEAHRVTLRALMTDPSSHPLLLANNR